MTTPATSAAIERVLPYLVAMHNNRSSEIKWRVSNSGTIARRIRDAIKECGRYKDFAQYSDLTNVYKIRILNDMVIVTPRGQHHYVPAEPTSSTQVWEDEITLEALVGLLIYNRPKRIHFKKVLVDRDSDSTRQMEALYTWCHMPLNKYWIIDHGIDGITLTSIDPGELAWKPEQKSSSPIQQRPETMNPQEFSESLLTS